MPRLMPLYSSENKSNETLSRLLEKEKQSYVALSAILDFINGQSKHTHDFKANMDFNEYKYRVLKQAEKLKVTGPCSNASHAENQFNVMHYQRVILSAEKVNSRNMAIMAALHNLTPAALKNLVRSIKKICIKLSKEIN